MRTTTSTTGTTGKIRGASVTTTLAALALALPLSGLFGGAAFASATASAAGSSDHGKASAPGQTKRDDGSTSTTTSSPPSATAPASNQNTTSKPYTNQGDITTGSNTTKYEVVNGRKAGSPAVGGGQPSGYVLTRQPYSRADNNNTGANDKSQSNPYRSTRNGAPSLNGNGGGRQVGQPCAGCVGKADNKNPPGQAPGGSDHNAGYECDRNHGIGRSNPAHTGCVAGTTPPPPVITYCPGTTIPMPTNSTCDQGSAGGGGQTQFCPHTTIPMPVGGVHSCPSKPTYCPGTTVPMPANSTCDQGPNGGGGGQTQFCPHTTIPMPANGKCDTKTPKPPVSCPHGSAMPASGNIADCTKTPDFTCASGSTVVNDTCTFPGLCPVGTTMGANGTCTPPVTCPAGTTMAEGDNSCTPPVMCPEGAMAGPVMPGSAPLGCYFGGANGGGANGGGANGGGANGGGANGGGANGGGANGGGAIGGGANGGSAKFPPVKVPTVKVPTTAPVSTVVGRGSRPQPVLGAPGGAASGPALVSARPTALPFTGGNAGILAEGAGLMLLFGAGLALATRKKAAAAA